VHEHSIHMKPEVFSMHGSYWIQEILLL